MSEQEREHEVVKAVLYAMRHGCFFPVPELKPHATVKDLIRWGAMRNLHTKVSDLTRLK